MKAQEVARSVMRLSNVTQQSLADLFGKGGQSTISMMLQNRNMKIDSLLMILNECGYELVARSKDGVRPEFIVDNGIGAVGPGERNDVKLRELIRIIVQEELDRRERLKSDPFGDGL